MQHFHTKQANILRTFPRFNPIISNHRSHHIANRQVLMAFNFWFELGMSSENEIKQTHTHSVWEPRAIIARHDRQTRWNSILESLNFIMKWKYQRCTYTQHSEANPWTRSSMTNQNDDDDNNHISQMNNGSNEWASTSEQNKNIIIFICYVLSVPELSH